VAYTCARVNPSVCVYCRCFEDGLHGGGLRSLASGRRADGAGGGVWGAHLHLPARCQRGEGKRQQHPTAGTRCGAGGRGWWGRRVASRPRGRTTRKVATRRGRSLEVCAYVSAVCARRRRCVILVIRVLILVIVSVPVALSRGGGTPSSLLQPEAMNLRLES